LKVGDKTVYFGLEVVQWDVPPSLDAMMDKLARAEIEHRAEEQKLLQELQRKQQRRKPKPGEKP
jgi:hypothetical protein